MSLTSRINDLATRIGQEFNSVWSAINGKANLASPAFSGTPTSPTPTGSDNSTKLATTAFVQTALGGGASEPVKPVSVYSTSTAGLSTTLTEISFDEENFDENNYHDNVTNNNRLTVPADAGGYHLVSLSMELDVASSGVTWVEAGIRINGVDVFSARYSEDEAWDSSDFIPIQLTQVLYLADGDYVTAWTDAAQTNYAKFAGGSTSKRPTLSLAKMESGVGEAGVAGQSAYQIAVSDGFSGTLSQWLASLAGSGISAYDIAVVNGYVGTEAEWLDSLVGGVFGWDNISSTLKGRATDNDGAWDFNANGIIDAAFSGATTISFTNLKQNKMFKVKLTTTNSPTITLPSYVDVVDGSSDPSVNGTYYLYFDCLEDNGGSEEVLLSIIQIV